MTQKQHSVLIVTQPCHSSPQKSVFHPGSVYVSNNTAPMRVLHAIGPTLTQPLSKPTNEMAGHEWNKFPERPVLPPDHYTPRKQKSEVIWRHSINCNVSWDQTGKAQWTASSAIRSAGHVILRQAEDKMFWNTEAVTLCMQVDLHLKWQNR
jgi:hypothetical protein